MSKADPEFKSFEDQEDPPVDVSWKQKVNFLGLLRLVIGQVRDSSGRPNNILGLLYAYMAFFFFAFWWATHPAPIKHNLNVLCSGTKATQISSSIKIKKGTRRRGQKTPSPTRTVTQATSCAGATIYTNVTLPQPSPLPSSFYWVLVVPFCALLGAYLARNPKMRSFLVNMVLAYRSIQGTAPLDDLTAKLKGLFVSKEEVSSGPIPLPQQPQEIKTATRDPSGEVEREH